MLKINTSVTDFAPLFKGPEYLFRGLKETGIDGIELVIGIKSRWAVSHYKYLSKKYDLPIMSLHQPIWSGLGIYFDEGFIAIAQELQVKNIVFHPLPKISLQDKRMREYLKKLSVIKKRTGINILLENLPKKYNIKYFNSFYPLNKNTGDILELYNVALEYDLQLTLDIDHLGIQSPHKEKWFDNILPKIANIHLSSFDGNRKHLPLYLGKFQATDFVNYLNKKNYQGLLTFEIYYPNLINPFDYNFEAIKKSLQLLNSK